MTVDILFVAANRLAFTEIAFDLLIQNTPWEKVNRLVVYDDASIDGTAGFLADATAAFSGCPVEFNPLGLDDRFQSPVGVMVDYLAGTPADWFVKVDNDIGLPPGWFDALTSTAFAAEDRVDILGFEAGMTQRPPEDDEGPLYEIRPARHIGGIGLMRTDAFRGRPRPHPRARYFGFTEWQHNAVDLNIGWLTPDLRAPLFDRLPIAPFESLSDEYVSRGWQRVWPKYDSREMRWSYFWVEEWLAESPAEPGC